MADRTFTLDWRIRTRKHETLMRAKLGTLDTQLSFRKRVRGPVRVDPSMLVPSSPDTWYLLGLGTEEAMDELRDEEYELEKRARARADRDHEEVSAEELSLEDSGVRPAGLPSVEQVMEIMLRRASG